MLNVEITDKKLLDVEIRVKSCFVEIRDQKWLDVEIRDKKCLDVEIRDKKLLGVEIKDSFFSSILVVFFATFVNIL